jgi:hypothetical protein
MKRATKIVIGVLATAAALAASQGPVREAAGDCVRCILHALGIC